MSKSLNNQVFPQDVIKKYGADILRLWVATSDYTEDQRIGEEILKTNIDAYRKLRNSLRWLLGSLSHFDAQQDHVDFSALPELEKLMLHRLNELDSVIRAGYRDFDYKKVFSALFNFMTIELSAFYFDIRKDALYCDPLSSLQRRSCLTVLDLLFERLTTWLAPLLSFTAEECWLSRYGNNATSVHLQQFLPCPQEWHNAELATRWRLIKEVRKVTNGALEIERREKKIGSSLEAHVHIYTDRQDIIAALKGQNMGDICITSGFSCHSANELPSSAHIFTLSEVEDVQVVIMLAEGKKCARSWKISSEVGSDNEYPDVTPRDADALRELKAAGRL